MTRAVNFDPQASEYERRRVGYGREVPDRKSGPAGLLLDLVCGTGLSTEPLARLARGAGIGADVAPAPIARAQRVS